MPPALERLLDRLSVSVEAVAVCRVAPGWRLRLPAARRSTFHFVLDGAGGLRDGAGRRYALGRGSLAVVPSGRPNAIECGGPVLAEAAPEPTAPAPAFGAVPELRAGPAGDGGLTVACGRMRAGAGDSPGVLEWPLETVVVDFSGDVHVRRVFGALLEEVRQPRAGTGVLCASLMTECVVRLARRLAADPDSEPVLLGPLEDPSIARVLEAVLDEPDRCHSVASLAAAASESRSAFSRHFRESVGMTPMAWVREVRLRRGAELLRRLPGAPVKVIARRVGYTRSHFSRSFRERFGCSPDTYRRDPF